MIQILPEQNPEKYIPGKDLFCSINVEKIKGNEFLKFYIGNLSFHLTSIPSGWI